MWSSARVNEAVRSSITNSAFFSICELGNALIAGSLESANSSILAARRHFKEVVGKKIRIL